MKSQKEDSPASDDSDSPIILVIEDDPSIGQMLTLILADEGYCPIWCDRARDGLRVAKSVRPQAVLLDLRLPDLSGQAVLRALKTDPRTSRVPVVIVSANTASLTPEERQLVECVLDKPFDIEDLITAVRREQQAAA